MSRLADYPFEMVRLACSRCPRKGQYRKATLLERFGPDQNMVDLRADPGRRVPQNRRWQRGRRLRRLLPRPDQRIKSLPVVGGEMAGL
jgi:hypothetical protein